jgi:NADH-quinone oxidoreductase subunit K
MVDGSVPLSWYLTLSSILFTLGLIGVLCRRNMIIILMSVELMLNAVNLTLVAFSRFPPQLPVGLPYAADPAGGQVLVFFVMAIAAAEVAVGLSIIVALFRLKETVLVDRVNLMRD